MIDVFTLYKPIGPLSYLLMLEDGQRLLGIYNTSQDNRLVLIFRIQDREYVLNPEPEQLDALMENKVTVPELMFTRGQLNLTTIEGLKPSLFMAAKARWYLEQYLSLPLEEIRNAVVYPNYYYLYKEFIFNRG